jgi:uncharacterized Zn finger protein
MSRYYGGWAPYVPVEQRRRAAAREVAKMQKNGRTVSPVLIEGRQIAATFWGKAWCDNLESYRDYENRLPRGRTYVRNGSVIDLQIAPREVRAMVSGSSIYSVSISIGVVPAAHWQSICADCSGGIDSLVELLQGRLSKGVMERICRQANGLFPKPSEIRFSCSCPDSARMCKHIAATLYGVGARLDREPELLFRLRAVDEKDLVATVGKALPASKAAPGANVLETDDLSSIFGLDMAATDGPIEAGGAIQAAKQSPAKPARAGSKPAGKESGSSGSKAPARGRPVAKSASSQKRLGHDGVLKGAKADRTAPHGRQAMKAPSPEIPAMRAAAAPVQTATTRKSAASRATPAASGVATAGKPAAHTAPISRKVRSVTTASEAMAKAGPGQAATAATQTPEPKEPRAEPVKWWLPGYGAKTPKS